LFDFRFNEVSGGPVILSILLLGSLSEVLVLFQVKLVVAFSIEGFEELSILGHIGVSLLFISHDFGQFGFVGCQLLFLKSAVTLLPDVDKLLNVLVVKVLVIHDSNCFTVCMLNTF
jgi:hypothetical protein